MPKDVEAKVSEVSVLHSSNGCKCHRKLTMTLLQNDCWLLMWHIYMYQNGHYPTTRSICVTNCMTSIFSTIFATSVPVTGPAWSHLLRARALTLFGYENGDHNFMQALTFYFNKYGKSLEDVSLPRYLAPQFTIFWVFIYVNITRKCTKHLRESVIKMIKVNQSLLQVWSITIVELQSIAGSFAPIRNWWQINIQYYLGKHRHDNLGIPNKASKVLRKLS